MTCLICHAKFTLAKLNALHSIPKSTSSEQPPDQIANSKKFHKIIDYSAGSHQFDDPNHVKRPTVYIAHTTVFDAGDDKNPETLLESLKKKLATQPGFQQNLAVDEALKHESLSLSDDEVVDRTDKQEDRFATDGSRQADNVWSFATMNDSDVTKDDKLLQRPEPIVDRGENKLVVNTSNLKPSHIRYRYENQSEEQMLEELAKKYLNMERDQIDKRLSQDMERLGRAINTSEVITPSVHINVSCDEDSPGEVGVPKHEASQKRVVLDNNPQYYDQLCWCNHYFNKPRNENTSETTNADESVNEVHKVYVPNAFHDDILPLPCCFNLDPFDKSSENYSSFEKLGFKDHDDNIPFHTLQCMDFIQLDLKVNNDKNELPVESIIVDENLPLHLCLQGNLIDHVATASNTIDSQDTYDFITPFENLEVISKEPVAGLFHNLLAHDTNVTKFDYTFPGDYSNVASTLNNQNPKYQTLEETSEQKLESDRIIQFEDETVPNRELELETYSNTEPLIQTNILRPNVAEHADATQKAQDIIKYYQLSESKKAYLSKPLVHTGQARPEVAEPVDASEKVQEITNENITDTIVKTNPHTGLARPEVAEPIDVSEKVQKITTNENITDTTIVQMNPHTALARPEVVEEIDVSEKEQKITTNENITDTIVQMNSHTALARPEVSEQIDVSEKEQKITSNENITDTIMQMNPRTGLTRPEVSEQIDVSEKVQKTITNENVTDTIVQMNPQPSPKTGADIRNLINAKVMEQVGASTILENTKLPNETPPSHRIVQFNPQSLPNGELTNIIHAKVLEQIGAPFTLKHTSHSLKGIDAIVQMQPQNVSNIYPKPKIVHIDPLSERKVKVQNSIKPQATSPKNEYNTEQPELSQTNVLSAYDDNVKRFDTNLNVKETKQTNKNRNKGTDTMAHSWVQTVPTEEAQKTAHGKALSIPETLDDVVNKLSLDLNLSLSELLRRVQARNRLQYCQEVKTQIKNMSILSSEKRCPPSDRPQSPPPPECVKPCPPPPKPKCPPEPPKCPPEPPKCPPEPPKCPPAKSPKCPPEPPQCPEPPKCPPEPPCPCPCPPPPGCPPQPPKCACQSTNPEDPITFPYLTLLDNTMYLFPSYLRNVIKLIKKSLVEPRNILFPATKKYDSEITTMKLNRIKDFEPWTPIPSWPFPVEHRKQKLQCPYHGCPCPKPGPVRPNCPELPCVGFPKRLSFSDVAGIF